MSNTESLNFGWKFKAEYKEDFTKVDFPVDEWETVNIPHTNLELPYNNFDETSYQFESCYVLDFKPESNLEDRVWIEFEAVMTYAIVYLNGKKIGSHKGGYTPFKIEVTDTILRDKSNRLTVYVDSNEREEIPPFGFVIDYLCYGGIYREVNLISKKADAFEDIFIKTLKENDIWKLKLDLELISEISSDATIALEVLDKNNNLYLKSEHNINSGKKDYKIETAAGSPNIWSPNSPELYTLKLLLVVDNKVQDIFTSKFGFRCVDFDANGLLINQERIKIRGLNRHQSFPYTGYAMPASAQYQDALILKEDLGVNCVRSSHYPPSRHFLDACDELGILVFNEIPGWQHIGEGEWHDITRQHTKEMILRDRNHPSVFIWGVRINESHDNHELFKSTNKIAKELDDTRPTGGVRNFKKSEFFEDVYTYNDFIHSGGKEVLEKPKKISGGKHPYLVTEHNGHMFPTKKFDHESRRIEQLYRHMRVLNAAYKDNNQSGAIGWCMFDYNTHKDFGSGDRICYHGVLDMFREPKYAHAIYASQQSNKPYGFVASSMQIGEMNASTLGITTVLTNSEYIKFYKNGNHIGDFYPDNEEFKYLPNPPIFIDDYIGNLIEKSGDFSKKDAKKLKRHFQKLSLNQKLSPFNYIALFFIMLRNGLKYRDMYDLYLKYVGNWGVKSIEYKFEGYKNKNKEWTITKGPATKSLLIAKADKNKLVEDKSWDTTRVVVRVVDEYNNVKQLASDSISISIDGAAELIGPSNVSLIAGSSAFWIKTKGKSGKVRVKIEASGFEDKELDFEVEKI